MYNYSHLVYDLFMTMTHEHTLFPAGMRVEIDDENERFLQTGTVVLAAYDDAGSRIRPTQVAIEVDNGQGVWGYNADDVFVMEGS